MIIADVLTSAASWQGERPLLSYTVPAELVAEIQLGQLVAVPYGERMVEGIVWGLDEAIQEPGSVEDGDEFAGSPDEVLVSLHAILDPRARVASLSDGTGELDLRLLRDLVGDGGPDDASTRPDAAFTRRFAPDDTDPQLLDSVMQNGSLRLRALIGLLLEEGEINVERLKELLGPKKAKEVLKRHAPTIFFSRMLSLKLHGRAHVSNVSYG